MLSRVATRCRRIPRPLLHRYQLSNAAAIEQKNAALNALVFVRDRSESPETHPAGPLEGISVAFKDNICTSDMPTTCSSRMLGTFRSPFDATVVQLLREAGASVVGKTNCDEFGMGSCNAYSMHGPAVNPYQPPSDPAAASPNLERRSPGGSSGGSAAAVASGMCDIALGTDTGGSIRLPASYCGIPGFKPSYGIISRWGVVSYADSLDCVGILARDVRQIHRAFDVLASYDSKDPTAARPETRLKAARECRQYIGGWHERSTLQGLRIGIPQEYFPSEVDKDILTPFRRMIETCQQRLATVVPVSLHTTPYALSAYYVIATAEASSNLARYDGIEYGLRVDPPPGADKVKTAHVYSHSRTAGFGSEVQKRILLGTYALTADAFDNYFLQAQRVRTHIRRDFDRVFRARNVLSPDGIPANPEGVDVLLHPSAIRTAPTLAEATSTPEDGDLSSYVQDVLTVPASLAGLPAMSVPAGLGADQWPVGVSVIGQWGCDEMVLAVSRAIEAVDDDV